MISFWISVVPPKTNQQTQDNVGVQAIRACCPDQGNSLLECQRL
jgi:hypothetical protein